MKTTRRTLLATAAAASLALALPGAAFAQKKIVMGFSQIGAESEWRTANSTSMKAAAAAPRRIPCGAAVDERVAA